jgi:hypothetical protein
VATNGDWNMNTTMTRFNEGDEQFNKWFGKLLVIAGKVELEDACDIYSFATAYDCGQTPQQAWNDYQLWVNA